MELFCVFAGISICVRFEIKRDDIMNCDKFREIESRNLFGKLDSETENAMFSHIEKCEECRASYELYKICQKNMDKINVMPEPLFIKEKVNSALDREYGNATPSLFDFIFGYGHNPIKAGLVMGLGLLAVVVLSCNFYSMNPVKNSKTENFRVSHSQNVYFAQFSNEDINRNF